MTIKSIINTQIEELISAGTSKDKAKKEVNKFFEVLQNKYDDAEIIKYFNNLSNPMKMKEATESEMGKEIDLIAAEILKSI